MAKLSPRCTLAHETIALNSKVMSNFSDSQQRRWLQSHLDRSDKKVSSFDVSLDVMINAMLSGLGTPLVNVISIALQQTLKNSNETIGFMLDSIGLTKGGREWKQVKAMWDGSLDGFFNDMLYFREGFTKGYSLDQETTRRMLKMNKEEWGDFVKTELKIDHPDLMTDRQIGDVLNDMQDYMHNSIGRTRVGGTFIEGAVRFPTKLIVGIDEYGKSRYRRQGMYQLASKFASEDTAAGKGDYASLYKEYKKELFPDGDDLNRHWDKRTETFIAARHAERWANKSTKLTKEEMMKEAKDLGNQSVALLRNDALFNAFQQRLEGLPKKAQDLRHKYPAFALFAPFIKTPWNIVKEGYNYIPIIPTIQIKKIGRQGIGDTILDMRTNIIPMHGPAQKMSYSELLPRQIIGMSVFAMVGTMFQEENLTGSMPRSPTERQRWQDAGIKPYSILIGDTWVEYARIEPLATPLSMAADLFTFTREYMDDDDINTDEAAELTGNLLYALKSNLTSKTFLEGFHSLTNALIDPNVDTGAEFAQTFLRPFTPAITANIAKAVDKYERQTETVYERLQARIPFYREQLPKKFGVYGEAKETDMVKALFNMGFSSATSLSPLQNHLMDIGWDKGGIVNSFKGVKLSSEQLAELRQLNAEALTPVLTTITSDPRYQQMATGLQKRYLDSVVRKQRSSIGKQFASKLRTDDPVFAMKWLSAYYKRYGLEDSMPDHLKD
jgi:hypothetical protein